MSVHRSGTRRWRNCTLLGLLVALVPPSGIRAQVDTLPQTYHQLGTAQEIGLGGLGLGLFGVGYAVSTDLRDVPVQGLSGSDIGWRLDRGTLDDADLATEANIASDWTRTSALLFPLVLSVASQRNGDPWGSLSRSSVVYAETLLISQGLTLIAKNTIGRARPYAYVPATNRPHELAYDVTQERTFRSMPSGHASAAWAASSMGMTEYLLNRPSASWLRRAAVGFAGGALAGATASLRVEAGQHFPTDVLAGTAIGVAVGVTIPLLHRGQAPAPSARSWLHMSSGAILGGLLGSIVGLEF